MSVKRIAHRGFSSEAPENTEAAFALAVEGDFFGVECDVWKCRDGAYVISHDDSLLRMCGKNLRISKADYSEVRTCPVLKGKKANMHPVQHPPLFTSYLSILARAERVCPVVELKMDYSATELRGILSLVRRYGLEGRTYFISLYPAVLLRLKDELSFPAGRLQFVYGATRETKLRPVGTELEQWLVKNKIHLDARYTLLSRGNVMRLHESGILVNAWTVNRRDDYIRMADEWGVDMITTEYYFRV